MVKTKNCLLTAAAVSAALVAQSAAAFEFHGYFRAGVGGNSEGGDQSCFQLDGAPSKYRLGNECENYGELIFQETVYEGDDGSEFGVEVMTFWNDPGNVIVDDDNSGAASNNIVQSWAYARNVAGGALEGAQFWIGERYYMRRDVHMTDYFYWNTQNNGGGVEDIQVGDAHFAYAYLRPNVEGSGSTDMQTTLHDLRLYDLGVNPGGTMMLGVQFTTQSAADDTRDDDAESGYMLTAEHTQDDAFGLGGFNRIALQYADGSSLLTGSVDVNAAGADTVKDNSAFQIVEQLVWNNDTVSGQATAVYKDVDDGDEWISLGVRPVFHVNQYFNITAELGYDEIDPDTGDSRDLTKFTLAPEITPDTGFFSRPALRLFVTYANWSDEGDIGAADFANETDGFSYGLQAEAWW